MNSHTRLCLLSYVSMLPDCITVKIDNLWTAWPLTMDYGLQTIDNAASTINY